MKTVFISPKPDQTGSALALTIIMTGIALAILAGAMTWSANSTKLTHRSIQYSRSVAAAEGATEKVLSQISRDYLSGGEKLVEDNLPTYRGTVPTPADSSFWAQWEFNDSVGTGQTFVQRGMASNYIVLNSTYAGLRGYATAYTVVSHARETTSPQHVVAGVLQEVLLTRIPIFQFAMFSAGDMEISCGQAFAVTGQVHANKTLYVEPDNVLTFQSGVTAVTGILEQRHPDDPRGTNFSGSWVFQIDPVPDADAMTLPIGTTNTPEAIREIIQPPPAGEDSNSPMGRLRYFNLADMMLVVSNTGIWATSGRFNNFATNIHSSQVSNFVSTANSFRDAREEKTVRPIDINVGFLAIWSQTNKTLRVALGARSNLSSVYVLDRRTLGSGELAAVRVRNGTNLPVAGLTVATARPLYVLGHYNQTNTAFLGTSNTSTTRPASLVADAITILSTAWSDADSTLGVGARKAAPTTVNAALLTGVVETTSAHYSGGMENFPRFLEKWGKDNIFTYNGSMVRMFPSLYATNGWGKADVYDPPKRNWAYDLNFNDPLKLPPVTPSLQTMIRGQWAAVAPDKNTAEAIP